MLIDRNVQEHWPEPDPFLSPTGLMARITLRKLNSFMRAALSMLTSTSRMIDDTAWRSDARVILRVLRTRVVTEMESLPMPTREKQKEAAENKSRCARVIMEVMAVGGDDGTASEAREMVCQWLKGDEGWRNACQQAVEHLVGDILVIFGRN
jgi:hypothetical protein